MLPWFIGSPDEKFRNYTVMWIKKVKSDLAESVVNDSVAVEK